MPETGWGTNRADLASQVLVLVNRRRAGLGLAPLVVSRALQSSAEWKSLHMARYHYFAHDDSGPPEPRSAFARIAACGYSGGGAGENIAYGYRSPEAVVAGWLSSPGHRANIDNGSYRSTGIGAALDASGTPYWTQDFGTSAAAGPPRATARTGGQIAAKALRTDAFVAGSVGAARVAIVSVGDGRPLPSGNVHCSATVDGKALRVIVNVLGASGQARCVWRIPADAIGKVVRGSVGVRVGASRIVRVFSRPVR